MGLNSWDQSFFNPILLHLFLVLHCQPLTPISLCLYCHFSQLWEWIQGHGGSRWEVDANKGSRHYQFGHQNAWHHHLIARGTNYYMISETGGCQQGGANVGRGSTRITKKWSLRGRMSSSVKTRATSVLNNSDDDPQNYGLHILVVHNSNTFQVQSNLTTKDSKWTRPINSKLGPIRGTKASFIPHCPTSSYCCITNPWLHYPSSLPLPPIEPGATDRRMTNSAKVA